jgi:tetratricopeptide (TPR) repeat protein/GAF domain-containing protein
LPNSFAQQDTLLLKIKSVEGDSIKFYTVLNELKNFAKSNTKLAKKLCKDLQNEAKKFKSKQYEAEAQNLEGVLYFFTGQYDTAKILFNNLLDEKYKSYPKAEAYAYKGLGIVSYGFSDWENAIINYQKALKLFQKSGNEYETAQLYNNIGLIYQNQDNPEKAIYFFHEAISIYKKNNNLNDIGGSLNNIGITYFKQKKFDDALKFYTEAKEIREKTGNKSGVALGLYNIASVQNEKGNLKDALENCLKSIKVREELQDKRALALCFTLLSKIYLQKNNNEAAQNAAQSAYKYASETKSKVGIRDAAKVLSDAAKARGEAGMALSYLEIYAAFQDSLYGEEKAKEIARLQTLLETDKRERDMKILQQQASLHELEIDKKNSEQKMMSAVIFSALLIALIAGIGLWQKQKANRLLKAQSVEIICKNSEINQQNDEIAAQNEALSEQKTQLEQSFKNIQILSDIGQKITASLNTQDIVNTVYRHVNEMMPAEGFGIGIVNWAENRLDFPSFIENGVLLPPHRESLSEKKHLSAICVLENRNLMLNNFPLDYQSITGREFKADIGDAPLSAIFLPILIDNQPVGVITVQSFRANVYTETNLFMLNSMASYIAIALDNAKAYKELNIERQKITDSIRYAETIQNAILPAKDEFSKVFSDYFLLFRPKDIVSGDFFWLAQTEDFLFLALADCTGHGVPGAFMSMIGHTLLNEIVKMDKIFAPSLILKHLHQKIRHDLRQEQRANEDGMDISVCRFDKKSTENNLRKVCFSGAKSDIFRYAPTDEKLFVLKGNNKSVGGKQKENEREFQETDFEIAENETLYFFSDGIIDQINSQKERFGSPRLKNILLKNADLPLSRQKEILEAEYRHFRAEAPQTDDITLIAVKI